MLFDFLYLHAFEAHLLGSNPSYRLGYRHEPRIQRQHYKIHISLQPLDMFLRPNVNVNLNNKASLFVLPADPPPNHETSPHQINQTWQVRL